MIKISKLAVVALLIGSMGATILSADAAKGQKLYSKKLKKACGFNGGVFAGKHSQDEWEAIKDGGKLKSEIEKICPKVNAKKALRGKYMNDYYDFFYNFANDSGNVPSC